MKFDLTLYPHKDLLIDFKVLENEIVFRFKTAEYNTDSIEEFHFAKSDFTDFSHDITRYTESICITWEQVLVSSITDDGDTLKVLFTDSGKTLLVNKKYFEVWKNGVWE